MNLQVPVNDGANTTTESQCTFFCENERVHTICNPTCLSRTTKWTLQIVFINVWAKSNALIKRPSRRQAEKSGCDVCPSRIVIPAKRQHIEMCPEITKSKCLGTTTSCNIPRSPCPLATARASAIRSARRLRSLRYRLPFLHSKNKSTIEINGQMLKMYENENKNQRSRCSRDKCKPSMLSLCGTKREADSTFHLQHGSRPPSSLKSSNTSIPKYCVRAATSRSWHASSASSPCEPRKAVWEPQIWSANPNLLG